MANEKKIELTPNEYMVFAQQIIESNEALIDQGKQPIAVNVEGEKGIGKTECHYAISQDNGYTLCKINLGQFEMVGDLLGYNVKEFQLINDMDKTKTIWTLENLVPKFCSEGWSKTDLTRTVACPPEWVVDLPEKTLLYLDDYSRANPLIMQASMELLDKRELVGWNLPKYTQIFMSSNPDNGEYQVTTMDAAQSSRAITIGMKWSLDDWTIWSEKRKRDERAINFVLANPELFEDKKKDGITGSGTIIPRMMDKFLDLVSTIPNFNDKLEYIRHIGEASIGGHATNQFIKFIHNKLDKLPSIDKLMNMDEKEGKKQLTEACGNYEKNADSFNGASAAVISIRLANYCLYNKIDKAQTKKLGEYITHTSFTEDQKFMIVKKIATDQKMLTTLMANAALTKYLIN